MFFLPFSFLLLIIFIALFPILVLLFQLGLTEVISSKLGFPPEFGVFIYFLSLFGSFINIPIKKEPILWMPSEYEFLRRFLGLPKEIRYRIIAVNLGGCIIPVLLSIYLLKFAPIFKVLLGIIVMAILCYFLARPVPGIGITIPMFMPPLLCFLITLILEPGNSAFAYIVGVLGTLIGADLLHLGKFNRTKAGGIMSIGGAGVFDGIFLVGILSVLLV